MHVSLVERPAGVRAHGRERVHSAEPVHERDTHVANARADRFAVDELVDATCGLPAVVLEDRHVGVDANPARKHEMPTEVPAGRDRAEAGGAQERATEVMATPPRAPRRDVQQQSRGVRRHVRDADATIGAVGVVPIRHPGCDGRNGGKDPARDQSPRGTLTGAPRECVGHRR